MLPFPPTTYLTNQILTLTATIGLEHFVDRRIETLSKVAFRALLIIGSYYAFFALAPMLPLYTLKVLDALTMFSLSHAIYRSINAVFDRYIQPRLA